MERCRDLPALRSRGGRRRFSGPVQGDAAAEVEEDERRGGGGGARALGFREEEDDGKGRVTKT